MYHESAQKTVAISIFDSMNFGILCTFTRLITSVAFLLLSVMLTALLLQARKDATQVVANLQRQQVHSKLIASDYLEANIDLMDILMSG